MFGLLASLIMCGSYGTVTIRFEGEKVTQVEVETRQMLRYQVLPDGEGQERLEVAHNS